MTWPAPKKREKIGLVNMMSEAACQPLLRVTYLPKSIVNSGMYV